MPAIAAQLGLRFGIEIKCAAELTLVASPIVGKKYSLAGIKGVAMFLSVWDQNGSDTIGDDDRLQPFTTRENIMPHFFNTAWNIDIRNGGVFKHAFI